MPYIADVINNKIQYEKLLTEYVCDLYKKSDKSKINDFVKLRAFDKSTVDDCGIFYVDSMTEMLLPKYFDSVKDLGVISNTNNEPIFRKRWVIPIKNSAGLVENLVGYSPYADERYIYGTSKYYRRRDTYYGLENLNLAYELGYAFVTEGITDTIRLRDMGYKNSFAMCGTHSSEFMIEQLNRCRYGVILIPDRDDPGLNAHKGWDFYRSITIFINFMYKDIDEMCTNRVDETEKTKNLDNIQWFKECAEHCIDWVKRDTHNGIKCACEKITMV